MKMENINKNLPIAINKCKEYDYREVKRLLGNQFESIIADRHFFEDKNVVIKPNLLMKASPDKSITTHPVVLEAVIEVLKGYSPKSIVIAESPGGPYTHASLSVIYKAAGFINVSEKTNVPLNYDTSSGNVSNPDGRVCKVFDIITPIKDADIIVNICKLKTHSLTTMSASIKNLFGTIPGIEKFEMHTRYKEPEIFEKMLVDLCEMHCKRVPVLSVVDAIYGMEGNGPSGGDARNYGLLLSSLNPFNLDVVCSAVLGIEHKVGYVNEAIKRGLCHANASSLELTDGKIDEFKIEKVKLPETKSLVILKILPTMFGGKINKFFEPKPAIMKNKCVGCGECMRSCPAKTIEIIKNKSGKRLAKINAENCIKCYCCQELCPINAVKIKKNLVFKILK